MIDRIWAFLGNFTELIVVLLFIGLVLLFIYDRYVQRKHQLLINYPVIGRFRYFFEALREPLRQYFAEETFYESRDKVEWVYKAAKDVPNYQSFSVSQPFSGSRFVLKHSANVKNEDEVSEEMFVTFGENRPIPFVAKTPIIRSAMSDGALSPEAVRAFSLGAKLSGFTVNTGEGSLTSNHLYTFEPGKEDVGYLEVVKSTPFAEFAFTVKGHEIANYHKNLIKGMRTLLAIMGFDHISQVSRKNLTYKEESGEIYFDVDSYFKQKLHLK